MVDVGLCKAPPCGSHRIALGAYSDILPAVDYAPRHTSCGNLCATTLGGALLQADSYAIA